MRKQIYTLLILITAIKAFSQKINEQGFPFIQTIAPKEYGYESQNFSIAQNEKGIFFISNVSGIIQYDGNQWKLINVNGIPKLCSNAKGEVYVGAYKDFGKIELSPKNNYEFVSLIPSQKLKEKIGDISSIISYKNEILFVGNYSYLYSYNGNNLQIIDSTSYLIELFKVNNKLFVFKEPGGLYQYANGNMIQWLSSNSLDNKIIEFLLPYGDKFLLKFNNEQTFYILTKSGLLTPFKNQVEAYVHKHQYSASLITPDSIYVFGTLRGGIVGMNTKGNILFQLSTDNLLINDNVNALYLDKWNNVWASLNNGLVRIELSSAFSYFSTVNGVKGGVSDICRFNNDIYIATTQGIRVLDNTFFMKQAIHAQMFKPINNLQFDCNKFYVTPSALLVSSDNGLYYIDKKQNVHTLYPNLVFESFLPIDSSTILVGMNNGIGKIKISKNNFYFYKLHSSFSDHFRTLAFDSDSTLWLGTDYNGVYHVKLNKKIDSLILINHYQANKDFPLPVGWIDVYNTQLGVLFSTQKGLYRFNKTEKKFYLDTFFTKTYHQWIYPLREDNYYNIWFSSGKEGTYEKETKVAFYQSDKQYHIISAPFKIIRDYTIESIYPDINAITWFGTVDGLIRFDATKKTQDTTNLQLFLTSIIAGNDTIPITQSNIKIKYKNHNLRFEFISPYFDSKNNILYSYYLEGFDNTWSNWTPNAYKEYTNLFEGKYVFHIKAKNIYNIESKEITFSFTILPPIYRTWFAYLFYITLLISLIIMIYQWRGYIHAQEKHKIEIELNQRTKELAEEKEKVEHLIRNILPEDIIQNLKEKGTLEKTKYALATVLFADVQGFTHIAEKMSPDMLIDELNIVFKAFDEICEKYKVEKLKTIGDAYMCAGGVPKKNRTNPIDVTLVAIKMQEFVKNNKDTFKYSWSIRIGIHCGSVVAGVVGNKKMTYDIWGDTVNIASRMESSSLAGEINISGDVYAKIKDYFVCEYRGKLPVKHKGEIDMYFVKGIKPELCQPNNPNEPNEQFILKLQFLKYEDLESYVLNKLERSLPSNLYYHDIKHTIDVITQVELLALGEKVSREELLLLKTAALLHDSGFMFTYEDHEEASVKYAREILPKYDYKPEQIETICRLILATKFPPSPKDKLEMIICDADLDYLGRNDFILVSHNLFRELFERGKIRNINEWNKLQYEFIRTHQYFTETAKRKREINKINQIDEINKLI